jgi:Flp pilus assembly protein TadD
MHRRFIVGIIASLGSFTLPLEATGAESPGPDLSALPRDSRTSSSSREVIIRIPGLSSVRVEGKLGVLIAEGTSSSRSKQYDRAISLFNAALQMNSDKNIACILYYTRAIAYGSKRNYTLAIRDSTTAIRLNPKFAGAYHNRGAYYAEIGDFDKAIADFSEAIRFTPSPSTFANRALAYRNIEKSVKAMADYDRVLHITPKYSEDYSARGSAYFEKGNYKEAVPACEKALQLSPRNDSALGGLAWLRATCPDASLRNGKEAIRMSTRACELSKWSEQDHLQALAAAYAESGDFDKAVKYQTQGINMKSVYGPLLEEARERLAFYRDHRPWRAKPLVGR